MANQRRKHADMNSDLSDSIRATPAQEQGAADRIKSLEATIANLRRDLADPPGDVQEAVLRKLGLWPPPERTTRGDR